MSVTAPPPRRRSLWPREHGAYAQLAAPLVAALLGGSPSWASALFTTAAVAAFLANEPLLVSLGHRGPRIKASDGMRARRRAYLLGVLALATGLLGLGFAARAPQVLAMVAVVPAAGLVVLAWRRAQHSLAGEIVAAFALPAASVPVASASGVETTACLLAWSAWSLGYAATTVGVHRVIARHRAGRQRIDVVLMLAMAWAVTVAVAIATMHLVVAIVLPLIAVSAALVARPPRATRLRAIGVALVIASVASAGIAAHALRSGDSGTPDASSRAHA